MSSSRRIVVAINPNAAFGKHPKLGATVLARLRSEGFDVLEMRASSFEALRDALARELTETDALLVVGGDGMVSLAVNLVANTRIPFAVMPGGTGNDFARQLNMPVHDLDACLEVVVRSLRAEPVAIDLGHVTSTRDGGLSTYFACVLSAGFDAFVNERANRMRRPRGRSRYTWAIFFELIGLQARPYELTVEGETRDEKAVLISVANSRNMGGGMFVTPEASITDGLLDVFIVRPLTRLRLVRLLPSVFKGEHIGEPEVHIERAHNVRLNSPGIVAYADGERIGPLPLDVSVAPGAALLLHPD